MPDLRSMVTAGKSNMNGADNSLLTGGTVLGAILGGQLKTLFTTNLPPYTPAGTNSTPPLTVSGGLTPSAPSLGSGNIQPFTNSGAAVVYPTAAFSQVSIGPPVFTGTPMGGTSTPFSIVQPTIVLNKIIKVH
jgi:hypothetical protein